MKEILLGILLVIQGGIDFKYKEIPLWISLLGAIVGLGFCIVEEGSWESVLIACIPGCLSLLFSKITREVIGYGDSILLVVMGFFMPLEKLLSITMLAVCIAGVVALVLLIIFQKKGKEDIPFIPFLGMAYWTEYVIALGEKVL